VAGPEAYPPPGVAREARYTAAFVFDCRQRPKTLAFLKNRHLLCLSGGARFRPPVCTRLA
jgi:hypothetical protein